MPEPGAMTQILNATDVRARWSEIVEKVTREQARIIVETSGVPLVAIISADDLARLQRLDAERERDFAILDRVGEAFREIPAEELEAQVARALAEVRTEDRQRATKTA